MRCPHCGADDFGTSFDIGADTVGILECECYDCGFIGAFEAFGGTADERERVLDSFDAMGDAALYDQAHDL